MDFTVIKRDGTIEKWDSHKIKKTIQWAVNNIEGVDAMTLENSLKLFIKPNMQSTTIIRSLIDTTMNLMDDANENWGLVAGRLAMMDLNKEVRYNMSKFQKVDVSRKFGYNKTYEKILWMVENGYYDKQVISEYSEAELKEVISHMNPNMDDCYTYSQVTAMQGQYLLRTGDDLVIELPQEMYIAISLIVASIEHPDNKVAQAIRFYEEIHEQFISPATPTVANMRIPNGSGTSCSIVVPGDSLDQISHAQTQIKKETSKGTGFGEYMGFVRSRGSDIAGHEGVAGGQIPYINEINASIISTDQLGVRDGNIAIYTDIWHADVLDFVSDLKSENGDQRSKAHDIFRGLNIPNLFWERKNNREKWTLFDPYEVKNILGFHLADTYGAEFEEAYLKLESLGLKSAVTIEARKFWISILKKLPEEGDPYIFFRDHVNEVHANKHINVVYASNLCTEIASIFTPDSEIIEEFVSEENGERHSIVKRKLGYATTCNLVSINLSKLPECKIRQEQIMRTALRFVDNVVSLTKNANPSATAFNEDFRSTGIGYLGYGHFIAKNKLLYGKTDAIKFTDDLLADLTYYTLDESCELAKEKGAYKFYEGSEWSKGIFFGRTLDQLPSKYKDLYAKMQLHGLRNGYLFAIAPNTGTSVLTGTTPSIYPIKGFIAEKEGIAGNVLSAVPEIEKYRWYYRNISQVTYEEYLSTIEVFQKWVDQSISCEIYFIPDQHTPKDLYDFYDIAFKKKQKTVYYCKNKRITCKSCAN